MIRAFADRETESLFYTGKSRKHASILTMARRKLQVLDNMNRLDDLRKPSGNGMEAMKGDRRGQHSIRINDRYRICFIWRETEPHEVEIVDCH